MPVNDNDDAGVGGVSRTTLYNLLFEDLPPKDFMHQCKRSINKVKNNPAECRQVLSAIVQWTDDNPFKYSEDSCLGRLSTMIERFLEALDVDELDDKDTMQFMKLMREFFRKVSARDIQAVGDWEVSSNLSPNLRLLLGRAVVVQQSEAPIDWVAPSKAGLDNSAPLLRGDDKDSDAMSKAEPKDDRAAGYAAQVPSSSLPAQPQGFGGGGFGTGGFGGGGAGGFGGSFGGSSGSFDAKGGEAGGFGSSGGGFGGNFGGGSSNGGGAFDAKGGDAPTWGSGFGGPSDGGSKWGGDGGSSGSSWSAAAGQEADAKEDFKGGDDKESPGMPGRGAAAEDEEEAGDDEDDEDYDDDDDDDEEYNFDDDDGDEPRVPMNMSANLMRALGLDTSGVEVESDWKPPERSGIDANPDSWKMG
jgi:hypothetical protein